MTLLQALKRIYLRAKDFAFPGRRRSTGRPDTPGPMSCRLPLPDQQFLEVTVTDPSEYLQAHWLQGRWYEFEMLQRSAKLLKPNSVVIDIGACIGNHSLFWAHACGAKVIAFEPHPDNASLLARNAAGASIVLHQVALGARRGNVGLEQQWGQSCGSVTVVEGDDVEMGVLDDYTFALDRVDLIKIDVEDLELQTLIGARDTLARFHPALLVEVKEKKRFKIVDALLTEMGYRWTGEQFNATPTYLWM